MAKQLAVVRATGDRDEFIASLSGFRVFVTDPDPRPATAVVFGRYDGPALARYEVEEHELWDEGLDGPSYSMFAFFRPPSGKDDWLDCYRAHADVARIHHPGIKRYVQDVVISQSGEERWRMSAISELHFAGRDEYHKRFWLSDESRDIVQRDFERFSDPSTAKMIVANRVR